MHLLFAAVLALTQQWLLVSDLHVNPFDRSSLPSSYGTDTNWVLFDESLAQMRRSAPKARVVIISGDFLAHKWDSKSRDARVEATVAAERTMARIAGAFGRAFPRAQFIVALGNNDDPCGDYRVRTQSAYLRAVAKIWEPLVDRGGASPNFARDFSQAGYYTAALPGGAKAVVLDDVPFSTFYAPCGPDRDAAARELTWLNARLAAGAHNVVVMHIPPGIDGTGTLMAHRFIVVPFWRDAPRATFLRILAAHGNAVPLMIAGHTHRLDFRLPGGVPLLVTAAISPIYNNNPAFLVLTMQQNGVLQDYTEEADVLWEDAWGPFADFDTAFGVKRFDAPDLRSLHLRLGEDEALRYRWERAMVAGSPVWRDVRRSWRAMWCAETNMDGAYTRCAGDVRRVTALWIAIAIAAAAVLLVIFSITYGMLGRRWIFPRRNG